MKTINSLPMLLHAFFHDWMAGQRSASRHTILSYRDTWRLFLRSVADRRSKQVAALTLPDLDDKHVIAFLDHIEKDRGCTVATRNCRLAALHSFFGFVADRDPLAAAQCAAVLRVPNKRAPKRTVAYLETNELEAVMAQPDRTTKFGQRDHALLSLLYNTGGRISEILDLSLSAIRLDAPAQVRLYGKGRKERICPLWPETADLLSRFLKQNSVGADEPIFRNRYGEPLGASGVRYRLKGYLRTAATKVSRLNDKRVSPHTFRHSAAVHMIAAGVDVAVIRSILGHVSLDTTNIYAQANLETKRKAIEKADGKLRPGKAPRWKKDSDLLAWLDSL
jgi:site-specific recombinase XerD